MGGRETDGIMLIVALSEEEANTHWILPKKGPLSALQTTASRDPGVPILTRRQD